MLERNMLTEQRIARTMQDEYALQEKMQIPAQPQVQPTGGLFGLGQWTQAKKAVSDVTNWVKLKKHGSTDIDRKEKVTIQKAHITINKYLVKAINLKRYKFINIYVNIEESSVGLQFLTSDAEKDGAYKLYFSKAAGGCQVSTVRLMKEYPIERGLVHFSWDEDNSILVLKYKRRK